MMIKFRIRLLSSILLIFICPATIGMADSAGTTTAGFLKIGTGTRPIGMGGAYVALSDDVNAVYWNPAGLGQMQIKQFAVVHTIWFEKIYHDYIALAYPLNKNNIAYGFSIVYFGTSDIDKRSIIGEPEGTAKIADYAVASSVAKKLSDTLYIGATIKGIHMNMDQNNGTGVAVDLGLLKKLNNNLSLGFAAQNMGPKMKVASTKEKLPLNYKIGLAYKTMANKLTISSDVDFSPYVNMKTHLGAEYRLNNLFAMQVGFESLSNLGPNSGMTAGISINEDMLDEILNVNMQFDYAWLYFGDLGSTHRIGISVKF